MAKANSTFAVEVWKTIPGYEGYYEASSRGRVRSVARVIRREKNWFGHPCLVPRKSRVLAPSRSRGRRHVTLSKGGLHKYVQVHQLVALVFLGPVPEGKQVNHRDGDPANNTVENLEYVTPSENQLHASRTGLMPVGERHHKATITPEVVRKIRRRLAEFSGHGACTAIGKQLGVSWRVVQHIKDGETWKHVR
jgi:hypothetical protein